MPIQQKMFFLLSAVLVLHSSHGREEIKLPPPAQRVQQLINELGIGSPSELMEKLPKKVPLGFTFVLKSESNQKGERGVLYAEDGSFQIGIGKNMDRMELIAIDLTTGRRTLHNVWPKTKDRPTMLVSSPNPSTCVECHTRRGLNIMSDYLTWGGFLGENHDFVDPTNADYLRISKDPFWKPLFAHHPPSEKQPVFPYHHKPFNEKATMDQSMATMANYRLTNLVLRTAAVDLIKRLKTESPLRFQRYKYAFLIQLYCREERNHPQIHEEWEKLVDAKRKWWERPKGDTATGLEILQILGTEPDEIILKTAINPKDRNAILRNSWGQGPYDSYNDGVGGNMVKYLQTLLFEDMGIELTYEERYKDDLYQKGGGPAHMDALEAIVKAGEPKKPQSEVCKELKEKSKAELLKPIPAETPLEPNAYLKAGHEVAP